MKKQLLRLLDRIIWKIYFNAGNLVHYLRQKYDYIEDYQELNEIEAQEVLRKPKRKETPGNPINKKS